MQQQYSLHMSSVTCYVSMTASRLRAPRSADAAAAAAAAADDQLRRRV